MTVTQIDARIKELKAEKDRVQGLETEVYARIVGYYRSVRNWNKGKKEEYGLRTNYAHQVTVKHQTTDGPKSHALELVIEDSADQGELSFAEESVGYLYFYRKTCPNCPPVASWLKNRAISGRAIDVDLPEGMEEARSHDVTAAPTVILLDAQGRETGRGSHVEALEKALGLVPAV